MCRWGVDWERTAGGENSEGGKKSVAERQNCGR